MSEAAVLDRPAAPAPTSEQALLPAQTATAEAPKMNPFDKAPLAPPTLLSTENANTAQDRKIRSYVDAEGKPLGGIDELSAEIERKVAAGDDNEWNNLVQTMRDAKKNNASTSGEDVAETVHAFEKQAQDKYKELLANKNKTAVQPEKLSLRKRIAAKLAGKLGLKSSKVAVEKVAGENTPEKSRAYRIGFKLGQLGTAKQNVSVSPVADVPEAGEAKAKFAEVDEAQIQKLSNEDLKTKYHSMDVKDEAGIAKIIKELEVRDIFQGLDREIDADKQKQATKEAEVQSVFKELDADEAKVQATFQELDADEAKVQATLADLDKEAADKQPDTDEAVVQETFAKLDSDEAAVQAELTKLDAVAATTQTEIASLDTEAAQKKAA